MLTSRKRLLLLSGSRLGDKSLPGGGFLEFAFAWIAEHFADAIQVRRPLLFVPYAMPHPFTEEQHYVEFVAEALGPLGLEIISARAVSDPALLLPQVGGIFVGGGNTYRLLDELYRVKLLEPLKLAIANGLPYLGSSAGTILTCPTIATTNDMHSRVPPSLLALNAIPFQVNCHFMDDGMFDPKHNGETRSTRIAEYLRENRQMPVLGIREGTALRVVGDEVFLVGDRAARLFRFGREASEIDGQAGSFDIQPLVLAEN